MLPSNLVIIMVEQSDIYRCYVQIKRFYALNNILMDFLDVVDNSR